MKEKAIYDESSALAYAKIEGKAEGKAEGEFEEKLKIAKNLKNIGVNIDVIQKATGLNVDEITKN